MKPFGDVVTTDEQFQKILDEIERKEQPKKKTEIKVSTDDRTRCKPTGDNSPKVFRGVEKAVLNRIQIEDFVIVRIADEQGRNHKLFLAHVEEVYGNYEFLVVFLKSYRETINEFIYPPKKDCADKTFEDIVGKNVTEASTRSACI